MTVNVPVDSGARCSTSAGRRHRHRHRGTGGGPGLAYLIGGMLLIGVIALFTVIALIIGGLVLIGYGIYLGVLAHQRGLLRAAEPPTTPIPMQGQEWIAPSPVGRTVFGFEPSTSLSGACVLFGLVMVIGGIAVVSNANDSQDQRASATGGSQLSTILPTATPSPTTNREPGDEAPVRPASPIPTTTTARAAPTTRPERVEPPSVRTTVPAQPVESQPGKPQPVKPQRDDSGGDAIFYRNCLEALAAGAAPIKRGEPGYRFELDRTNDGTACDK